MSIINLALSNCVLARDLMDDKFEKKMKKCSSMSSVRKLAATLDSVVAPGVDVVASLEMVDASPPTILATTLVDGDALTSAPFARDTHVVISDIVTEAITTSATTFGATANAIGIVDIVATHVYYIVDDVIAFFVTCPPTLDPFMYSDFTYVCGGVVDGSLCNGVPDFNMSQELHDYMMEDANGENDTYANDFDVIF